MNSVLEIMRQRLNGELINTTFTPIDAETKSKIISDFDMSLNKSIGEKYSELFNTTSKNGNEYNLIYTPTSKYSKYVLKYNNNGIMEINYTINNRECLINLLNRINDT